MTPLADTHMHLLADLDDEAVAMCRLLAGDTLLLLGIRREQERVRELMCTRSGRTISVSAAAL